MTKMFLRNVMLLFSIVVFGQKLDVKVLEDTLSHFRSGEVHFGTKNHLAYQLLERNANNEIAINYLVNSYKSKNQIDSIRWFLQNLCDKNPKDLKPYLLRKRYATYEQATKLNIIHYLEKAHSFHPKNDIIIYELGRSYYDLCIEMYTNKSNKDSIISIAKKTIYYFEKTYKIDSSYKELLKYPLIQMSNLINNNQLAFAYSQFNEKNGFYPIQKFITFPDNWEFTYSLNLFHFYVKFEGEKYGSIDEALYGVNYASKFLNGFEEYEISELQSCDQIRFLLLPTFRHPIMVRLEKCMNTVTIYWKESDGAGGYDFGNIIVNKSKALSLEIWNEFVTKLYTMSFFSLPILNIYSRDGTSWYMEACVNGNYHVVFRKGGVSLFEIGNFLLKHTDLDLK